MKMVCFTACCGDTHTKKKEVGHKKAPLPLPLFPSSLLPNMPPNIKTTTRKSRGGTAPRAKIDAENRANAKSFPAGLEWQHAAGTKRKKRRVRPGTKALREIRKYQKSTDLIIPREAFSRLVREIAQDLRPHSDLRFQASAITALQEASENFLVPLFSDAQLLAFHGKRISVQAKDMQMVCRLRNNHH